ncbi:MAG: DUF2304 domain-containing protein [Chitinophagaceae bacterium]|nr:DUF2304 domain-containing protein [Chitinophagaceae bacterium]
MSGIQIILISSFVFVALYAFVRLRNRITDVLLLAGLAGLAVFFVLFPGTTEGIAHKLNVGRGADLVFYCCIVLFWFVVLKLYSKIRKLEQITTDLIRRESKEKAETSTPNKS